MLDYSLKAVLLVHLGLLACIYSLPIDEEALLSKSHDEALAQDLINCTSVMKVEEDAQGNFKTKHAQVVRVFKNVEDSEKFKGEGEDVIALGPDTSGCAITLGADILYKMRIRKKLRKNMFRFYAKLPGTYIFHISNSRGSYIYVMRTYMGNQMLNFPLGIHINRNTNGVLYSQKIESNSFGWRKIDLEEVLNGYKENTDCSEGTNGAYRQMKVSLNYAAMELTKPFDESGYTKLGKCIFFPDDRPKTNNPFERPQLPNEDNHIFDLSDEEDLSKATSVEDVDFGGDSGENDLEAPSNFDEFGDPISDARSTNDLPGGVANEAVISEIKNGVYPGPEEEAKYATMRPIH